MAHSTRAEECFTRFLQSYRQQNGLLVALSGGADSVVLLHLAHRFAHLFGGRVEALHVHHGIRGEEADRDLAFCEDLCAQWGIPFTARRFDVPALAKEAKCGLEETARYYRYLALDACAKERILSAIATAHTATDNVETILLQLTRGAAGVIGIQPVRGQYIRPLLSATREDVLDYLDHWDLPHVEDSTNSEDLYSRNLIRHRVLPVLQSLNPKAEEAFTRAAEYSGEDSAYLDQLAEKTQANGKVDAINALPLPIRRRVILTHCRSLGIEGLSSVHLDAILQLLEANRPHSSLSLPGGEIAIEDGCVVRKSVSDWASTPWEQKLVMGENRLPDGSILYLSSECEEELKKYIASQQNIYKLLTKATFGFAIIDGELIARSRRAGDRILAGGIHRKVKKLFSEAALPLDLRAATPLICKDEEILWIPSLELIGDLSASSHAGFTHLLWLRKRNGK